MDTLLPEIEKLRPQRNDVILVYIPKQESTIIDVKEDPEQNDLQRFLIAKVGRDVKHVKEGEVALISWQRVTESRDAMYRGKEVKFGVTEETEILAIDDEGTYDE